MGVQPERLKALADPIPVEFLPNSIMESKQKKGTYVAMAFGYVRVQGVLNHLDKVLGPENWSVDYEPLESPNPTFLCRLRVKVGFEWVEKSAVGASDEKDGKAFKAAQTDALKRAAAAWGVGKFLQDIPKRWVACETYSKNGKVGFREWTGKLPSHPSGSVDSRQETEPGEDIGPVSKLENEPQPTETQVAIEKWCGWFQLRGVTPKRLEGFVGKPPTHWGEDILLRFEKVGQKLKKEGTAVVQGLEEVFGQPKLF